MMLIRSCVPIFVIAFILADVNALRAEQVGSVEIVQIEIFRCRQLSVEVDSTTYRGISRTVSAPKNQSFIVLWLQLKARHGKDDSGDDVTQIDEELIRLTNAKGEAYPMVGRCSRDGRFATGASGFYCYGEADKETVPYDLVFLAPEGMRDWTLKLGNATSALQVPPAAEETIDPRRAATFKVKRVRTLAKLEQKLEVAGPGDELIELVETIESPATRWLVVKVIVKPLHSNDEDGDFSLYTGELGVIYGDADYRAPVGIFDGETFSSDETGIYSEADADGEFSAEQLEVVFPLPDKQTKFRLTYLGQTIVEQDVPAER